MASPLGTQVLTALAEQGFFVMFQDDLCWIRPGRPLSDGSEPVGVVVRADLFTDPDREGDLRETLIALAIIGLEWPWPDPGHPIG